MKWGLTMRKICLFDADGTLFDFDAAEERALDMLMEYCKITEKQNALDVYQKINHALWKKLEEGTVTMERLKLQRFEEFIEAQHLNKQASELAEYFMDRLSEGNQLIENAEKTLRNLSKKYDCHIITNGITRIQVSRLNHSVIHPYIKHLFISEQIGVSKPNPAYFDYVKKTLNISDADQLIVIGDSLTSDMQGAINSNLTSIWYNPKHHDVPHHMKLDAVIYNLIELEEIIDKL